ncbi:MAG TPA: hypothetical protein VMM56_15690 [Planctomycetaceae bacterium]|nr:hypothetical protein [Planctomycetaceae bacterium]
MSQRFRCLLLFIWFPWTALFHSTVPAFGQDMKIRTHVYSVSNGPRGLQKDEQAVSLTIFHAGRVYDYIDSVREVIIFEPTLNRFRIISTPRSLVTTVEFDELRQMMKVAQTATEKYLETLELKSDGQTPDGARSIQFQLEPRFRENWKPVSKELQLTNSEFRYNVRCEPATDDSIHETYLRYADWTARLNYVLHPQSMYPEGRLQLNESLRKRKLYPIEVSLYPDNRSPVHLLARHSITWDLNSFDRTLIHDWETQLKQGKLKELTFREYQEAVLVTKRSR